MIGNTRQQEIQNLLRFVTIREDYGWTSRFWYYTLRRKYPFEFLQMANAYKLSCSDETITSRLDIYMREARSECFRLVRRFNNLLVKGRDEAEANEFEVLIQKLKIMIARQVREN